jgi:hypothetical protein
MTEGSARTAGRRPARPAAIAAGAFLVWRGLFGRGGLALALLGAYVLWRELGGGAGRRAGAADPERRRSPEVVEVKSPAELEPGIVSASPTPTSPDRASRRDPRG